MATELLFHTGVQMALGIPASHIQIPRLEFGLLSGFQFLAGAHPGGSRWKHKYLSLCYLCGRPGLNFLVSNWPSCNCFWNVGRESDNRSVCVSVFMCVCVFYLLNKMDINKETFGEVRNCGWTALSVVCQGRHHFSVAVTAWVWQALPWIHPTNPSLYA